jgi:RNA 2',3'-cyclic 3'-phosphodiesterase
MRTFISIDLPRECVNEIKGIQELLKKQVLFTGKYTEPENLHLTLKFLGDITDEQADEVKKRLSEIKISGFDCELGEIGVFSKSFIKIIWIKLNGKGIFNLQKQIDEKLKDIFKPEERFMSHVTIARVKIVSDKKALVDYLDSIKPKKIMFHVDEFYLKKSELKSEGPEYTDLEKYELIK